MKNSSTPQNNNRQTPAAGASPKRPEIRDNLDSREGEEQEDKGDDVTHNEKETKKDKLKKKKEE
ncbi:MAG: hypothetical protein INR73_08265 [Williamsia sp.]|nr:hypothetical protein [Williamsia sp.]